MYTMDTEFPGPFCECHGISVRLLREENNFPQLDTVSNGLVLELRSFYDKSAKTQNSIYNVLCEINSAFCMSNSQAVLTKLSRVLEQKKKLVSKKKVAGVKNIKDFLAKEFEPPGTVTKSKTHSTELLAPQQNSASITLDDTINQIKNSLRLDDDSNRNSTSSSSTHIGSKVHLDHNVKDTNLMKYQLNKLTKKCNELDKSILAKREEIQNIDSRRGHYSVRNVNKRDENAKKNLHTLRDSQRAILKQEKLLKKASEQVYNDRQTIIELKSQISNLTEELHSTSDKLENEKCKKLAVQKSNSYLKNEIQSLRLKLADKTNSIQDTTCLVERDQTIETLNHVVKEKDTLIERLESFVKELENEVILTKKEDGSYNNNTRLCVMELAGLEVAVEKVSPVIQTVCYHMTGKKLEKSELPNPHTVQAIVDEGHYIAKTFISQRLDDCENWGLGRDGTTRRKQKIVDTSVTLDSGDIISLGFNRVHKENAVTINAVTKNHLSELGSLHENLHEDNAASFVARSLEKLSFTMSDRASNEKLANELLDNWRDDVLKEFTGDIHVVHHFHCMAHVLLGFHSYATPGIKVLEKELTEISGPVGRDALPVFKFWSKKETLAERAVRTTSDVFGPSGDHHGLRDKWDAHCAANGVKSVIGNYKDNRFNDIFETAAQVFLHKTDFIKILESTETPNLKLQAVKSDLSSDVVCALLQCYGLFYVKVTGPYWNLVTSGNVSYLQLSPHINELKLFLENCVDNPALILNKEIHWSSTDPLEIKTVPHHQRYTEVLFTMQEETRDLLMKIVVVIASAMIRVIKKQLVDFLDGGTYYGEQEEKEHERTKFTMVTNLGCEHHFGDLDSSQRRRPSATMHHHSSVQLLKRNRKKMFDWLGDMTEDYRSDLLQTARKGGRELRKSHIESEKSVLKDIHNEMVNPKQKKRKGQALEKKKSKRRNVKETDDTVLEDIPMLNFNQNEYVAIAYQDGWYPGIVEEIKDTEIAIVKFMIPCRKPGYFQWPGREDKQTVCNRFLLHRNLMPDCVNSGRQWFIKEFDQIQQKFEDFKYVYF